MSRPARSALLLPLALFACAAPPVPEQAAASPYAALHDELEARRTVFLQDGATDAALGDSALFFRRAGGPFEHLDLRDGSRGRYPSGSELADPWAVVDGDLVLGDGHPLEEPSRWTFRRAEYPSVLPEYVARASVDPRTPSELVWHAGAEGLTALHFAGLEAGGLERWVLRTTPWEEGGRAGELRLDELGLRPEEVLGLAVGEDAVALALTDRIEVVDRGDGRSLLELPLFAPYVGSLDMRTDGLLFEAEDGLFFLDRRRGDAVRDLGAEAERVFRLGGERSDVQRPAGRGALRVGRRVVYAAERGLFAYDLDEYAVAPLALEDPDEQPRRVFAGPTWSHETGLLAALRLAVDAGGRAAVEGGVDLVAFEELRW